MVVFSDIFRKLDLFEHATILSRSCLINSTGISHNNPRNPPVSSFFQRVKRSKRHFKVFFQKRAFSEKASFWQPCFEYKTLFLMPHAGSYSTISQTIRTSKFGNLNVWTTNDINWISMIVQKVEKYAFEEAHFQSFQFSL